MYTCIVEGEEREFSTVDETIDFIEDKVHFEVDSEDLENRLIALGNGETLTLRDDCIITVGRKYEDDDIDLWGNIEPKCPHCGHDQETTDLNGQFEEFKDDEVIKTECDHCEKEFHVQLNMPVRYNTAVSADNL